TICSSPTRPGLPTWSCRPHPTLKTWMSTNPTGTCTFSWPVRSFRRRERPCPTSISSKPWPSGWASPNPVSTTRRRTSSARLRTARKPLDGRRDLRGTVRKGHRQVESRQTAPFPRPLKKTQNRPLQRADEGGGAGPAPEARAAERGLRRPEKRRRKASLHVDRGAQPPVSQHEPGQYCQTAKAGGRTPGGNSSGRRRPARHCRRRDRPVVQPPRKLHPEGQGDGNHASRRPH